MTSNYEMNKTEGYPPNPAYSASYPTYPPGPPAYPPNPPGYSSNPVYPPNQGLTYSNVPPPYYGGQPQPGAIVTTQPNVMVFPQPAYKDYLAWSVVNLIFFNLIFGIVALVYSHKTRDAVRRGDSFAAGSYSRTAFSLNVTALVLGIIAHICWISWVIYGSVTNPYKYNYSYYYDNGYDNGYYG
ncbi:interferon-induced transmembrane protein 1-like [Rana temporaria]|uniref:interferon-induced transmembrane protein 1-like n=1 Tax=Rana temporaria TaxID=8407 RepID=UPI001AAD36B2|nr:interferon-induced transmembrane protein 1-like [Rana temporaria]